MIRFLPTAYEAIAEKRIRPRFTYHFVDRKNISIGVAAGDICYPASFDDVSAICQLAVEFEDRRFFSHHGIDVLSIIRSALSNLRAGRIIRGGSTITQQLARNTLLTPDRSFVRKLAEMLLALKIERHYSKKEILLLYSQHVYLGNGVRGFPAASKIIYRRSIKKLDTISACGLIGLLRQPSSFNPFIGIQKYIDRQAFIIKVHSSRNLANDNNHERDAHPLIRPPNPIQVKGLEKSRWTNLIEKVAECNSVINSTSSPITRIGFTIDNSLQSSLDEVLRDVSLSADIKYASGVILDNSTADVLAESAWSDGQEWAFSPTFSGKLQPGSTFKVFAYIAALEGGISPDIQLESSVFESSFIKNSDGSLWRVRNYGEIYRGGITLLEALRHSDNTAFARLVELLDHEQLDMVYKRFGLCENEIVTPAIVLGGSTHGISLLSLVSAYSAIARNGIYKKPRVIRFVQSADGRIVHFPSASSEALLIADYAVSRDVKLALRHSANLLSAYKFSGKTGTTKKGSLFVGYNDDISVAIWLGQNSIVKENDKKGISAIKVAERWLQGVALGYKHDIFSI